MRVRERERERERERLCVEKGSTCSWAWKIISYVHNISATGDTEDHCAVESGGQSPKVKQDSFDEVYKPQELTDFDSLFNRNITRTSE